MRYLPLPIRRASAFNLERAVDREAHEVHEEEHKEKQWSKTRVPRRSCSPGGCVANFPYPSEPLCGLRASTTESSPIFYTSDVHQFNLRVSRKVPSATTFPCFKRSGMSAHSKPRLLRSLSMCSRAIRCRRWALTLETDSCHVGRVHCRYRLPATQSIDQITLAADRALAPASRARVGSQICLAPLPMIGG